MRSRPSTAPSARRLRGIAGCSTGARTAGKVRRCHGDLHLRNICLLDGAAAPVRLHRVQRPDRDGRRALRSCLPADGPVASRLSRTRQSGHEPISRRGGRRGRLHPAALLHGRAGSRARACHRNAGRGGERRSDRPRRRSPILFRSRREPASRTPARLIAIGGLSGSGKTTIAEALAAHVGAPPGARIVESDRIRKALHGVPPETRLPDKAYRPRGFREGLSRDGMARRAHLSRRAGRSSPTPFSTGRRTGSALRRKPRDRGLPFSASGWRPTRPCFGSGSANARGGPSDATVDILSRQLAAECRRDHVAQDRRGSTSRRTSSREILDRLAVEFHALLQAGSDSGSASIQIEA